MTPTAQDRAEGEWILRFQRPQFAPDSLRAPPRACSDLAYFTVLTLAGGQWVSRDSFLTQCSRGTDSSGVPVFRPDSGFYQLAADTVRFYVKDQRIGVNGWVWDGILKTDTLIYLGTEDEAVDLLFLRRHR